MSKKPSVVLLILDGFGIAPETTHNAIAMARTPTWDFLWRQYPHSRLEASGEFVGLPPKQMGNSEVGHLTIGSGRVMLQDLARINEAIEHKTFFKLPLLNNLFSDLKKTNQKLHLIGLVSEGGVHSHLNHLLALIDYAKQAKFNDLRIHAILDGRDTPPQSASSALSQIQAHLDKTHTGKISSLSGRYFAMDRDKRWDRILPVYDLLTQANAPYYANHAQAGLLAAYQRKETDEFVQPTCLLKETITDHDGIVFFNFRADRMRQLVQALIDPNFSAFERQCFPTLAQAISFTEYERNLTTEVLFPKPLVKNTLGEILNQQALKQFRIAETEKYAHVTYFLNAGVEKAFEKEQRLLIPSAKVATYDLKPQMSAFEITNALVKAIENKTASVYIANFANADMVGHTGEFEPTIRAIEVLDQCLSHILAVAEKNKTEILITADHGNAECMFNRQNQQPHTAHTNNPVPLVYVGNRFKKIKKTGALSDVAPTLLHLLNIEKPEEMTGQNLVFE